MAVGSFRALMGSLDSFRCFRTALCSRKSMPSVSCVVVIFLLFQNAGAYARNEDDVTAQCWRDWVERSLKEVPKSDDTISPRTGKELSQSDGAKRTRALKFQAASDALELRGKSDPRWQTFLDMCRTQ